MLKIQRVQNTTDSNEIVKILEQDGCIVIENVLTDAQIKSLQGELEPHFSKTQKCHGNFFGFETKRLSGLLAKSSTTQEMCLSNKIIDAMDAFLLRGCEHYQINLTQAISIGPGEPEQIIHTDDTMFPFQHPDYESMINCMWAVDDFTAENGGTVVVPGSHKWPKDRRPTPDEAISAEMKAGSVLIYFGSLLHGGGANRTNKQRTGLVISYSLGWLKQAENQFLAVPKSVAQSFPIKLQKLMGYFVHKPNLGCVEGQDPILVLADSDIISVGFEEFLPEAVQPILEEYRKSVMKAA